MKKTHIRHLSSVALGAAFLVLSAWLSFPIGAVSISLQSFGVFLLAGVLGPLRGATAVAVYLALGLAGIPVFAGFGAGAATLAGPTGGFLLALLPASLLVGVGAKGNAPLFAISLFFASLLLYAAGSLWYYLLFAEDSSYLASLTATVLPFLLPDALKAALSFFLTRRLRGKLRV